VFLSLFHIFLYIDNEFSTRIDSIYFLIQRKIQFTDVKKKCRRKNDLHETHVKALKLLPRALSPHTTH